MAVYEINVHLSVLGSNMQMHELGKRWEIIDYLVRNNSDWTVLRCGRKDHQVEHPFNDSLVFDHVYVAEIEMGKIDEDDKQFLFSLSDVMGQRCIAVCHPSTGYGVLVGPDADLWGPFDNEAFVYMNDIPE